jgi:hypothetical protein
MSNIHQRLHERREHAHQRPSDSKAIIAHLVGSISLIPGIGVILSLASIGSPSSGITRPAVIVIREAIPEWGRQQLIGDGWWYVPTPGYWLLVSLGFSLSILAMAIAESARRRSLVSIAGFAVNALAILAGGLLMFTTF